ncbi:MAG: SDR family NAD(P)-dependent oxidoreductase [Pikeienuella sp.]|uniref:SDR family NAD(P)-dependent oxidoreductase n=1 Tax=Pikeienuella sp. TaxID=2831957 RepID=UPI00391A39A7
MTGRLAIVTGAAQGIGAGIVAALRAEGATVTGIDRQPTPDGGIVCDLARGDDIVGAVAAAVRRMGRIDIIVNNAGVNERRVLGDIDAGHLDRLIAVNLRAPILVSQAALPHMGEGGRIVNVASELAHLGRAGGSVYAATKAGLIALTRSWARELSPRILVNAIAPGPTDTPLLGFDRLPPERRAEETANPMGRIGTVAEVAATCVFLCGPGGNFYTGQCLGPNGGAVMT